MNKLNVLLFIVLNLFFAGIGYVLFNKILVKQVEYEPYFKTEAIIDIDNMHLNENLKNYKSVFESSQASLLDSLKKDSINRSKEFELAKNNLKEKAISNSNNSSKSTSAPKSKENNTSKPKIIEQEAKTSLD
ncbi:MAG: hypothetical protein MUE53_02450 [Chitinophagales bacterium]|jgi:hypothetical protein|nr:hypothetical protein [Chitinophagales bacterium]